LFHPVWSCYGLWITRHGTASPIPLRHLQILKAIMW
jgi:hypothetical protein